MRRLLCLLLCVSLCSSIAMPVKAATDDYLNITLADIIIAWYNASGVAIGDTQLANAIYDTYGSITIDDLVEHDCLTAPDVVIAPNTPEMREYVRELIGYGNLTVPMIKVQVGHLQNYLSGFPVSEVARESLEAMFGWEGNLYNETMFGLLGMAIGSVANIGKIAYQCASNTLTDISQTVQNSYLGKTLLDIYRHFTDTTYFQDLIEEGSGEASGDIGSNNRGDYVLANGIMWPCGFVGSSSKGKGFLIDNISSGVFLAYMDIGEGYGIYVCNVTDARKGYYYLENTVTGNTINFSRQFSTNIGPYTYRKKLNIDSFDDSCDIFYGYAIFVDEVLQEDEVMDYLVAHNPWGPYVEEGSGVTNYINNQVGNIASDNYINLSPNIGNNEYMYIFDRPTYIETLNQITNNTDNGDYSSNTTVINNFNETYIEEPSYVTVRPSTAPADPDQPAQPFISPRPTQAPEEYEGIIYEGGISEEITKKFPFCIPWDIKAMIDRLWTPESRAPYIHWDATFGSWGKLGEVDIDLKDFNGVAAIFRSTTLLLWIVWLVIITRDLLG